MHAVTIFKLFKCNLCIQQIVTNKRHKVLTLYTNHPVGNFVHEHKTTKITYFDAVGERPTKKNIPIS